MNIIYKMNEEKTHISIVKILWADNTQPREKLRTKEWLLKISEFIDQDQTLVPHQKDNVVGEEEEEKKSH